MAHSIHEKGAATEGGDEPREHLTHTRRTERTGDWVGALTKLSMPSTSAAKASVPTLEP